MNTVHMIYKYAHNSKYEKVDNQTVQNWIPKIQLKAMSMSN